MSESLIGKSFLLGKHLRCGDGPETCPSEWGVCVEVPKKPFNKFNPEFKLVARCEECGWSQ